MNEYLVVFWTLIEQSLQIDADEYLILANVYSLPYMKKEEAKEVINTLRGIGKRQIYSPEDIKKDRERLKKILYKNAIIKTRM
jgi:hypothetical protein